MATSVLKQCVTAVVKVKRFSPSFSARRWLLSAAYTDTTAWEARTKHPHTLAKLAAFMDSIYERNFPVSSLTMSRFVDSISSREEVDQAEYYLYKFRHSPNCWYLRDWTIHSWVRQCLKYGAREKALYTLKNKVQYGIFPDDFTFNLLIDSCIKDGDFQNACSVVEEVMLQEAFDLPSTQILSLYTLGTFLSTRPQLTVSQQRGLGASLLLCGLNQENTVGLNAQLLGNTLLGKVEFFEGIHAVFRGMPLFWGRGYLGRALAVMEKVSAAASGDIKLSKDTVAVNPTSSYIEELDYVSDMLQERSSTSDSESSGEESEGDEDKKTEDAVDEDDQAERAQLPQYISRFKELNSLLESQGKVESSTFKDIVTDFAQQNLAAAEKRDMEEFEERLQTWEAEERQLTQREKEMRAIAEQEKREQLAKAAARAAARAAAQQA